MTGDKMIGTVRRTTEWRATRRCASSTSCSASGRSEAREGVELAYDPKHEYNVDEMMKALEGARRWYGGVVRAVPWKTLRLSEFAGYSTLRAGIAGQHHVLRGRSAS